MSHSASLCLGLGGGTVSAEDRLTAGKDRRSLLVDASSGSCPPCRVGGSQQFTPIAPLGFVWAGRFLALAVDS